MPKPSEVLEACGWKRAKNGTHPQDTKWIDPEDKKEYSFGEACRIQQERGWIE